MEETIELQLDYVSGSHTVDIERKNIPYQPQYIVDQLPEKLDQQYILNRPHIFDLSEIGPNHFLVDIEPKIIDITNNNPQTAKKIKRIIQITYIDNPKPKRIIQEVTLKRQASKNLVTGEIEYSPWSTDIFKAIDLKPEHNLVPSMSKIKEEKVTGSSSNHKISITYRPRLISQKVWFKNGKHLIHKVTFTQPDQTDITDQLVCPSHYEYVEKPKDIRVFDDLKPITIQIKPIISIFDKPIEQGKFLKGILIKKTVTEHDLRRTIHRNIVLDLPNQQQTINQHVNFSRKAMLNHVTGNIKFTNWDKYTQTFSKINLPDITDFKPVVKTVEEAIVTPNDTDINLAIPYQNKHYQTDLANLIVRYMYHDRCILQTNIEAHLGEIVPITDVPFGAVNFKKAPRVKLTEDDQVFEVNIKPQTILLTQPHPKGSRINNIIFPIDLTKKDLEKTVTRRVIFRLPSGEKEVMQAVTFTRSALFNPLDKVITYSNWATENNIFDQVPIPQYPSFRTSTQEIKQIEVDPSNENSIINVTYSKIPAA